MSSSDTQAIDDKKSSTSSESTDMVKNIGNFFLVVLVVIAYPSPLTIIQPRCLLSCPDPV